MESTLGKFPYNTDAFFQYHRPEMTTEQHSDSRRYMGPQNVRSNLKQKTMPRTKPFLAIQNRAHTTANKAAEAETRTADMYPQDNDRQSCVSIPIQTRTLQAEEGERLENPQELRPLPILGIDFRTIPELPCVRLSPCCLQSWRRCGGWDICRDMLGRLWGMETLWTVSADLRFLFLVEP